MKFNKMALIDKVEIQEPLYVILTLSLCSLPLLTIRRTAEGKNNTATTKTESAELRKLRFAIYLMLQ